MMTIKARDFKAEERIPEKFTCEGADINPAFVLSDVPKEAQSLMLIVDDPDATGGVTWNHWIVWNIPPDTKEISENWDPPRSVAQGRTSFGSRKYGGPCPPRDARPHRYFFKLYALDTILGLSHESIKTDVERATEGHVIASAEFFSLFGR